MFGPKPEIDEMAAAHDVEGLVALLGGRRSVRRQASQLLIGIGPSAIGPLVAALDTVGEPAATALAGIGPSCLRPLREVLVSGDEAAQAVAVRTLTIMSIMGDRDSFHELEHVADSHPNGSTRQCARLGLWDVMDPRASIFPLSLRRVFSKAP